jgi:hypothetical protein
MAISRPFLLALLGVVLLGATVFAVQNARNQSDGGSTAANPASQQAQPTEAQPTQAQPSAGPSQVLSAAFTPNALNSASFDAKVSFSFSGKSNSIRTNGAFESTGPKEMPKANVQVTVDAPGFDGKGGFVTTGKRAWFTRGSAAYAVPQAAWSKIVKGRAKGDAPTAKAPKLDVNPSSWLQNVKSEGSERMDGVQVTHVSADVNSAAAIADIFKSLDTTGRVPAGAEKRVAQVVDNGHIEAWVGDDKILRRATFEMSGKGDGGRRVDVNLDVRLSRVNQPQQIKAPSRVKKGLPGGTFGQFATGFVAGLGNTVGVTAKDLKLGVPQTNAHLKAERAVADHKKVVIFFQNPRALDDKAVADSVRSLDRKTKHVVVLSDYLGNVDNYGKLLENLGVNQAPAIVIVGRSGKAQLVEGYVDSASLVQVVADAR